MSWGVEGLPRKELYALGRVGWNLGFALISSRIANHRGRSPAREMTSGSNVGVIYWETVTSGLKHCETFEKMHKVITRSIAYHLVPFTQMFVIFFPRTEFWLWHPHRLCRFNPVLFRRTGDQCFQQQLNAWIVEFPCSANTLESRNIGILIRYGTKRLLESVGSSIIIIRFGTRRSLRLARGRHGKKSLKNMLLHHTPEVYIVITKLVLWRAHWKAQLSYINMKRKQEWFDTKNNGLCDRRCHTQVQAPSARLKGLRSTLGGDLALLRRALVGRVWSWQHIELGLGSKKGIQSTIRTWNDLLRDVALTLQEQEEIWE